MRTFENLDSVFKIHGFSELGGVAGGRGGGGNVVGGNVVGGSLIPVNFSRSMLCSATNLTLQGGIEIQSSSTLYFNETYTLATYLLGKCIGSGKYKDLFSALPFGKMYRFRQI
jgi:hypothetical protein